MSVETPISGCVLCIEYLFTIFVLCLYIIRSSVGGRSVRVVRRCGVDDQVLLQLSGGQWEEGDVW